MADIIIRKADADSMATFGIECPVCKKPKGIPKAAREWKASGRRDRLWVRCLEHDAIMQATRYVTKAFRPA